MAMLKYVINQAEDFEALDESVKVLYEPIEEADGKSWRLSVDGVAPKAKVDEFRERNIELARERDRLTQELSKLIPAEKVNEIAERLAQEKTRDLNEQLTRTLIDQQISTIAASGGARADALEDISRRARDVFKLNGNGGLAPKTEGSELTPQGFIESLKRTHAFYFEASNGGGAAGNRDDAGRFKSDKIKYREDLKSPMAKSLFIQEHGLAAFEALKSKHQPDPYRNWQRKQESKQ